MKLRQAVAFVIPVLVCGETRTDGDDISPGNLSRANKPNRHKMGTRSARRHHPTVPLPPVPGYDGALPRAFWRHVQEEARRREDVDWTPRLSSSPPMLGHAPSGPFRNLVLLLRFADHADRKLPSRDDIDRLYNSEDFIFDDQQVLVKEKGGDDVRPTGSVRQVYYENSHSTITIESTVVDWIDLPHTEEYYAGGDSGLAQSPFKEALVEALNRLDSDPDFDLAHFDQDENGALDGFGVLHSGYGAEFGSTDCHGVNVANRIWSHKGHFEWTSNDGAASASRYYVSSALRGKCKSKIVRMGVLCHEFGHYLGLPDLYSTTYKGKGLGAYDFMSAPQGWDGTGLFPGNLSAYTKMVLGWATADHIEEDGTYELEAATTAGIKIYKISHNFPEGEYLLLENRQPIAYDSKMKQGGIAIYHVDETARGQRDCGYPSQPGWPENGNHYKVALLAANGNYDLEEGLNNGDEGDLWHAHSTLGELGPGPDVFPNTDYYEKSGATVGQTGIRIFDFSESGMTMSFSVEGLSSALETPTKISPHVLSKSLNAPTVAPTTLVEEEDPIRIPTYTVNLSRK